MGENRLDAAQERVEGIRNVASAVLASPVASEAEVALALALFEKTSHPPLELEAGEVASIASIFNHNMDAAIDGAEDSRTKRSRSSRRAMMAASLDRAGLILMQRDMVGAMYETVLELKDRLRSADAADVAAAGADVQSAFKYFDQLAAVHSPETALQWEILRSYLTPSATLASDNTDADR